MKRAVLSAVIAVTLGIVAPAAQSETKANQLFGAKRSAAPMAPAAIGSYAKGCAAGLVPLAQSGPTWQAMRLSRNRNWGHPETISFIKDLSAFAATLPGWKGLYVGDIAQPRGGPMLSGHQSHQTGLDVDFWMLPANRLDLTRRARENLSSISVRSSDQRRVNGNYTAQHAAILRHAAQDPRVDRIFVTPPVKLEMCQTATRRDRKWLRKIRPLSGHHYHFHVRLKCPAGNSDCITQKPTVRQLSKGGDGCDATLQWWVTDFLDPPKPSATPAKPAPRKRGARDYVMADLPSRCQSVLTAD